MKGGRHVVFFAKNYYNSAVSDRDLTNPWETMKILETISEKDPVLEKKKVLWFSKNVSPTWPVCILLCPLPYNHCNGEK